MSLVRRKCWRKAAIIELWQARQKTSAVIGAYTFSLDDLMTVCLCHRDVLVLVRLFLFLALHSFYDNRSSIINSTVGRSKLSDVRDKTSSLNVEKTQVFFYISKRRKQYRDCTYTLYLDSKLRKFLVINKFMLKNIFSFFFKKKANF